MPLKDAVKVSRKTFFNPMGWLGYGMLKAQFQLSRDILKETFTPAEATHKESFAESLKRLKLTEADITQTAFRFFICSIVFVVCGVATIGFSFYLLIHQGSFAGWILGLVSATLFFVFAFRYSFWHFQIKHRKLGCTFAEWRSGKINRTEEGTP